MASVDLQGVYKIYDDGFTAVRDLSLNIRDREFMVLVGPSGCGKTTTLRMIAGLESVTKGEIRIGDRLVNDVAPKDRDIAMVFQNYALYPHMTVYENMAFALKLRKVPKAEIHRRVMDAAGILDLTDHLKRLPKQLSGGQRQRVALGRAIVRQPAVFLFDEPLSNLDAKMRLQMRTEIKRLHAKLQTTMIYVTHDQTEAMTMGDRICVMKDGVLQQTEQPLLLYKHPANSYVAGFIGTPPMNFFGGRLLVDDNKNCCFESESMHFQLPQSCQDKFASFNGREVVLGIRAEDIMSQENSESATYPAIKAELEVVEPMGAEAYWHLKQGRHSFIARVAPELASKPGSEVAVSFNLSQAHIFDAGSGERL